jgi:hypothetical protein
LLLFSPFLSPLPASPCVSASSPSISFASGKILGWIFNPPF